MFKKKSMICDCLPCNLNVATLPVLICSAAIIKKYYRLGSLNSLQLFLTILEARSLTLGCQQGGALVRTLFLACIVFMWQRSREGEKAL